MQALNRVQSVELGETQSSDQENSSGGVQSLLGSVGLGSLAGLLRSNPVFALGVAALGGYVGGLFDNFLLTVVSIIVGVTLL